jgi:hypothetical protein
MDVAELKSWAKHWNDIAMERVAAALPRSSPARWPMLGMLAIGLVAGAALGGYAVSQRAHMKRFFEYGPRTGDQFAGSNMQDEDEPSPVVTTHRSYHRRKTTSEV